MVSASDKVLFSWVATEYDEHERHPDWFWLIGGLTAIGILLSLFFMNFLLAIILFLGVSSLFILEKRSPDIIEVKVSNKGLLVGSDFYPYDNLKSFWVEDEHQSPHLTIHSQRIIFPHIRIRLNGAEPEEVRRALLPHLLAEKPVETLVENLAERLGF
jgi:hypothetical protein